MPSTGEARSPPGDHSLHGLSFPWVSGSDLTGGSLVFRRYRLPPQSFLPVGIGEVTPLVTSLTSSISSPSTVFPTCGYQGDDAADNLYWRRRRRLMLAMPSASYTGDAWGQRRAQGLARAIHVAFLVWVMGHSLT